MILAHPASANFGGPDGNGWARHRELGTDRARALAERSAAGGVQADARQVPRALDRALRRTARGGRLLVGHDRRGRPHGQPRLGDLLLRTRRRRRRGRRLSDRARARDVHRHGPAQARSPEGALPARLHAEAHRRPRGRDPRDHRPCARAPRRPRDVRPRRRRRPARRLARDRQLHGHLRGGRPGLGAPDELDARRRRPRPQPRRLRRRRQQGHPADLRALPQAHRRAPATRPTISRASSSTPKSTARSSRNTRSSWVSSC